MAGIDQPRLHPFHQYLPYMAPSPMLPSMDNLFNAAATMLCTMWCGDQILAPVSLPMVYDARPTPGAFPTPFGTPLSPKMIRFKRY
jgi:hypothetical protein